MVTVCTIEHYPFGKRMQLLGKCGPHVPLQTAVILANFILTVSAKTNTAYSSTLCMKSSACCERAQLGPLSNSYRGAIKIKLMHPALR